LYPPGTQLWRIPVAHWSPGDGNFPGSPSNPDPKPAPPPPPAPPDPDDGDDDKCGSIIEVTNQILGESLTVAGTPYKLNYRSDRVPGRREQYRLDIPISGTDVGSTTIRFDLVVTVAGRTFSQSFPPTANQHYVFEWDGLDAYGRKLQGIQPVTVDVGRVVPVLYTQPSAVGSAFAQYSDTGVTLTTDRVLNTFTISNVYRSHVGTFDARPQAVGGWTFDAHHAFDPSSGIVYLGDGTRRSLQSFGSVVERVAGVPGAGNTIAEGIPPLQAEIGNVTAVTVGPDGAWYSADFGGHIFRLDPATNLVTTVVSSDSCDPVTKGDGGPAINACVRPFDIQATANGDLFVVEVDSIRRINRQGIMSTVAGVRPDPGGDCSSGDGGPATQARLCTVRAAAVAPDGTIYILEGGQAIDQGRLRKVTPDGIIRTVRSGLAPGYNFSFGGVDVGPDGSVYIADTVRHTVNRLYPDGKYARVAGIEFVGGSFGDNGPATQAALHSPTDVTVASDGTVYIVDFDNSLLRVVTPDGVINTLMGSAAFQNTPVGDGGPPGQAGIGVESRTSIGPDGALYIAEHGNSTVRRIRPSIPGTFPTANQLIPSEDGREVYEFDKSGRHLRTRHALTGGTLLAFGYDTSGRLATLTDGDGNVTTVSRQPNGDPTTVVGPYGRTTVLQTNANGFVSSATDPSGVATSFTYSTDGLLLTMTDARSGLHQFDYDTNGRLTRDENPAGGFQTISRVSAPGSETITHTTAEGTLSTYLKEDIGPKQERHTYARDIATPSVTVIDRNTQITSTTAPDGMQTVTTLKPDPRWQMLSSLPTNSVVSPSGLTQVTASTQTATTSASDPLAVQSLSDVVINNGLSSSSAFTGATRTTVSTSPLGRTVTSTQDALGRPLQTTVPGVAPVTFAYDTHGRLQSTVQGSRTTTNTYNPNGDLSAVTNALNQTETFDHDPNGRVTGRHRADGTVVSFGYDAAGNLASVTPPGKPAHLFTYTPDNRLETYTAPSAGSGPAVTAYQYDLDGKPTQVTRPDGSIVGMSYDASGRMDALTMPGGAMTFGYHPTTGKLVSATGPYGVNLGYAYDGNLLTSTTWSGAVTGSVNRTYDNFFRVATETVNGVAATQATFGYDNDGLITSVATPAGSMALTYDPAAPRLQTTTLGGVTDERTYDTFGQLHTYTAKFGSTVLYDVTYSRDALGRIIAKDETVQGDHKLSEYSYDQVGRLISVAENGNTVRGYVYDDNGNRTEFDDVEHGTTVTGTYDAQDRMLTYGTFTYTYTADGAVRTKTDTSTTPHQTTTYGYDALQSSPRRDLMKLRRRSGVPGAADRRAV
jgi:YD repeat-containing protein